MQPFATHTDADEVYGCLLPVKPAAAATVAGRRIPWIPGLGVGTALLRRHGKRPAIVCILRELLKVGVGHVVLARAIVMFEINGKTAASHPK